MSKLQSIAESRSASSEGDEPWDVQRAHSEDASSLRGADNTSNNKMRKQTPKRNDETGDLPALSISRSEEDTDTSVKRVLSGQRTLRPLSPPSRAGMDPQRNQNAATRRRRPQDRDDNSEGTESDADDDEDMPMDELADRQQRRQEALGCVDDEGIMGLNSNLCDYTLQAMGEFCGGAEKPKGSLQSRTKSPTLELPKRVRLNYGVDEQTAIEVEYVDPMISPSRSMDATSDVSGGSVHSPRRKNAMLKAIAKRAKDDFQNKSKKAGEEINVVSETPDNVYSSFNASEKRKFLKLINSGLTPSDATNQVLQERVEGEKAMEQVGEGSSSKNSKSRLAFWKKNKDEEAIPKNITSGEEPKTQEDGEEEEERRFAKSGINYYDAVRKERPGETEEESTDDDKEDHDDEVAAANKSTKKKKSKNILAKFAKGGFSPLDKQAQPQDEKSQRRGLFRGLSSPKNQQRGEDMVLDPQDLGPTILAAQRAGETKSIGVTPKSPQISQTVEEAKAVAADDENEAQAAVQRGGQPIFKPIPVKAEAHQTVMQKSMSGDSQDSLLRDDDLNVTEEKKEDGSKDEGDDIEEQIKAQLLGTSPARSATQEGTSMEMGVPLNLDAYLNSTELVSNYGGGSVHDHVSVVSGKSYKTSGTTGTNYTTSTRSRRPGAAKQRLMAHKKAESTAQHSGWQESIQAAAAGTGRVWDPVKGWIDYVDPNTVVDNPENRSEEKIHIALDRLKRAQHESEPPEAVARGEPVIVPFPEKWQQERNSMLQGSLEMDRALLQAQNASSSGQKLSPSENPTSPLSMASTSNSKTHLSTSQEESPSKSSGWVETMKAATVGINKDGKRWDPERGWVGLDENEDAIVDGASRYDNGPISVQLESDTQDFGMVAASPQGTAAPKNNKQSTHNSVDHLLHVPSEDSSEEGSRLEVASTRSGKSGRYIQLGETGSVKSHYRSSKSKPTLPPAAVSPHTPETPGTKAVFGKMDEARREHGASLMVNVVKEKVDTADASLFPPRSKARGTGPVDLDDEEDATFDNNDVNFSWEADSNVDAPKGKQAVPRLKINMREPSPRDGLTPRGQLSSKSFDSVSSTGNKSIPKLRGPKRDTSPIRGRRSSSDNKNRVPEVQSGLVSADKQQHVSTLSQPDSSEDLSDQRISPPKAQRSIPNREANQLLTPTSPYDGESRHQMEDSSPGGSSVKLKAQFWEKRTSRSSPGDADENFTEMPTQANDWKSFLTKKMQGETGAAAKQSRRSNTGSDFDRDSLFEFPESEGAFPTGPRPSSNQRKSGSNKQSKRNEPQPGDFDEISGLSPIRKQEEDDDEGAPSEASSFAVQPSSNSSFLQRLQACAAPIMPRDKNGEANCGATSLPLAHLAFMKSNPSVNGTPPEKGKFVPPNFCGRPDVIHEDGEEEDDSAVEKGPETRQKEEKLRSRSNPRSSRQSGDVSSVISDEAFGAKTAYLESIAMKVAVSGSKKKRRSGSDTSGSSSKHSEKWQRFLDKKNGTGERSADQSSTGDVSKAAEKYAAEKVEEMMTLMANRSQSTEFKSRPMEEATGGFPVLEKNPRYDESRKTESAIAAEDLAAARVEAMMQALSNHNLDEGEI